MSRQKELSDRIAQLQQRLRFALASGNDDHEDALFSSLNPGKQDGHFAANEISKEISELEEQLSQLGE